VRAPNIAELFTPQVVGLDGSVDNCAAPLKPGSTTVLTTGYTLTQCEASGVKPAQFGNLAPNTANQYNGLLGGNPNLKPETADTYSAGFVISPRALPTLSFSVDYFNIKIKDIIGAIGGDTILNNCLNTGQANFCDAVHRAPNGSLWLSQAGYVSDTTVNQGSLQTKGFDLKAGYRQAMGGLGSLNFQLEGTYLQQLQTEPVTGFGTYDCVGFFGSTCGASNPKWRHVMNITWSTPWDALDLTLRWRYIGSADSELTDVNNPFLGGVAFPPTQHIPAYNYLDLSGSFAITKSVRLMLGINNITDKAPPLVIGGDCSTSSPAGANCNGNTFPGTYDPLGRYVFAHVTAQF